MILSLATTTLRHVSSGRARRQRGRGRARLRRPTPFPSRRVPRRDEPTHPPLPTTSEPDWAKPRRVAFCVGDDAAAVADAWAWTAARFLEPTDDVIMLRVWCPDAAAFRSDVDPDYAAEVDFHQERTTTSWLPPSVRDSLARREASFSGSHSHVVLRDVHANLSPRVRLPDTARATPWTSSSSARDPAAAPSLERSSAPSPTPSFETRRVLPRPQTRRLRERRRRGDRRGTGRGTLRGFRFDVAGFPGSPRLRSRGSPESFARNFRAPHARNFRASFARNFRASHAPARGHRRGRLGRVLSRGSMVSRRVTPPDGRGDPRARRVGVSERAFSRVYAERGVASRPVGGDDAHAAAATRDAWRALERALERAGTTPPYPSLGDGAGTITGSSRAAFLGEDAARLARAFPESAPWRRLDKLLAVVAAKQGAYRCGWPPRGAATLGPPRDGALRAAKDADADLIVVGSRATGGWRRAMSPSVSTHLVENAPCPCLVYREPAREDEGGKGGSASVTREDRFQISGPAVSLKPKTKFHR